MNKRGLVTACLALGWLLAAGGCGAKSENVSEGPAAAISGGSAPSEATATLPANAGPNANQTQPRRGSRLTAVFQTSLGSFVVELYPEHAPLTVDNFRKYADRGHYENTIFHAVHEGYVIIVGGFNEDLKEKTTLTEIHNEANKSGLKNLRGTMAMVRKPAEPHSVAAQFFINLADNPHLDYRGASQEEFGYCVFGNVVDGMNVVDQIARVPVHEKGEFDRLPKAVVTIKSVQVR